MKKNQLLFGSHVIETLLNNTPDRVLELFVVDSASTISKLAQRYGVTVTKVSKKDLDKWLPDCNHQSIAAQVRAKPPLQEGELFSLVEATEQPFLLILDGIQDPHNLGACLRVANAAGVDAVILPKDRQASLTPAVYKVSSGAAVLTAIAEVTNISRCIARLKEKGVWVVGLAGESDRSLFDLDCRGPIALVLGAEETGLRRLTREQCDHLVRLPMQGAVESLNVSVATGIALYETLRQRLRGEV